MEVQIMRTYRRKVVGQKSGMVPGIARPSPGSSVPGGASIVPVLEGSALGVSPESSAAFMPKRLDKKDIGS